MNFGLLTILLVAGTVGLYIWFFRAGDDNFEEQRQLPFDEVDNNNPEEE